MLRRRATWRKRMDDILLEKSFAIEKILHINEMLYDREVREIVNWLLNENSLINRQNIDEQINIVRSTNYTD